MHQAKDANETIPSSAFQRVEGALDAIRRRAFELFEARGHAPGRDVDDWLQAEREVLFVAHVEVHESETAFRMTMAVPGFDAADIDVVVLPKELLVEAKAEMRLEPRRDCMRAGALESRILYRRFDLATPVEAGLVTARVDEGSLTIDAPKKIVRGAKVQATAA